MKYNLTVISYLPIIVALFFVVNLNLAKADTYTCPGTGSHTWTGGVDCYITFQVDKYVYYPGETVRTSASGSGFQYSSPVHGGGGLGDPLTFQLINVWLKNSVSNIKISDQGYNYGFLTYKIPNNPQTGTYTINETANWGTVDYFVMSTPLTTTFQVLLPNTPPKIFVR